MNAFGSKLAVLTLGSLLGASALAQTVTDGQWRGTGAAAASVTSGNTSSTSVLVNLDGYRATDADKITLGGMFNYARSKVGGIDKTTANKSGAFGQYDYNLSPQVFGFGKLALDNDKMLDLSLRTAVTGGLGYKVINTPDTTFNILGGAAYTVDKYNTRQTIGNTTDTSFSRVSIYLGEESSQKLSSTVAFKQRLDLYPGITGDKAVLAKFTAGLNVAMNSRLSLNASVVDTYDSKPPVGFKANDLGVFLGLSFKVGAL